MAKRKTTTAHNTTHNNEIEFQSLTFRRDLDWVNWKKPSATFTFKRGRKEVTFNPPDRDLFRVLTYLAMLEELFPSFRVPDSERWDFSNPIPEEVFLEDVSVMCGGTAFGFSFTVSAGHPHLILGCNPEIEAKELFEILEQVERLARIETAEKKAKNA